MKDCCGNNDSINKNEKGSKSAPEDAKAVSYKVSGMDCADEIASVEAAFNIPEVYKVEANLMKETVTVFHDGKLTPNRIAELIQKAGLKIVDEKPKSFFHDHSRRITIVVVAGILLGVGLLAEWLSLFHAYLPLILFFVSILLSGSLIFPKALRSIKDTRLDMNVLMSVAVIGAIFIKEYSEAASVVFLFSLAELLEAMSVTRARRAIQEVLKIAPKNAIIISNSGESIQKDVQELKIGDILLVRPHDNIATDGVIIDGETTVNQASLTGESKAVDKKVGDSVLGGTINESGVIKVRVEKEFQDSKLSKVISLIESAQSEKAPAQKFVDKFASIYTPSVLILSLIIAILPPMLGFGNWDTWIYRSLVFLVIGCPCALVIATPVSVVSGLTSMAKKGILVKGGVHLETLGKIRALAVDKTGTITEGRPAVIEWKLFSQNTLEECLKIASSLESLSSHPLAVAILRFAEMKQVSYPAPSDFKVISGKGAEGRVEGHSYFVGNHKLAHELGVCNAEIEAYLRDVESQAMSVIVVGHRPHDNCQGEILAVFALADKIKDGIPDVITQLHNAGVVKVVMLSGDNQDTVSAVSKVVGIDYAKGGLLPENKVEEIKKLVSQYDTVAMVGDGVNDAPALATSSLGIAMGVVGSDTAIETADVALMKDDLAMIPIAIRQGKRVLNVIRFNISFAIAIKALFFVLAFLGLSNLWMAVAADMGASLLVTFNALRLLKTETINSSDN